MGINQQEHQGIEPVNKFKYLGIWINTTRDSIDIMKALQTKLDIEFVLLKMREWSTNNKLQVYRMKILSILRYSL